jgi:uracil-DNA glycosylase family 4
VPASLSPDERRERLTMLADEVRGCTACGLHEGRTHTVFSRGDPLARLCFVGEGPGEQEDLSGLPFVGPAGELLDRMIVAMGLSRDSVYVCNIVKCRPPGNRTPERDEMAACMPFLHEQLALARPEVIVALGATALRGLCGVTQGITAARGSWRAYKHIPVMPTFHPSYLLRDPHNRERRGQVWDDLKQVLGRLGLPVPAPARGGSTPSRT